MIVIHPKDKTTSFLKTIYEDSKDVTLIDETWSSRQIRETIGISPKDELILMLGHGYSDGLLAPYGGKQFARTIVDSKLVYLLKDRKCMGIWCYANEFAEKYGLKGLFSGMVISEIEEAYDNCIDITGEDINLCNEQYARDLEYCLRHYSLDLIPEMMQEIQDYHSDLKDFNYKSLYFYC